MIIIFFLYINKTQIILNKMAKTRNENKKNVNIKKNNKRTFGDSCVVSYEVFPPTKRNIHERKFNINSISGNKYTVTVKKLVNCSCPDCQYRVRRCKHIYFVMNNILHEPYPRIYYDNRTLDNLFKYLPGNIPHICN